MRGILSESTRVTCHNDASPWDGQADRSSIHSGNALLAIGELFIKQAHGPRPPLDLVNHDSPSSLRMFAVLDILRCAVEKGRRTVFDIEGLPGSLRAAAAAGGALPSSAHSTPAAAAAAAAKVDAGDNDLQLLQWSGFPLELILCLAATVNLDCDRSVMPPEAVDAVADKIEEAIRSWNPTRMQSNGYEDSLTFLQEVATKEMVRTSPFPSSSLTTLLRDSKLARADTLTRTESW